MSTRLRKGDKTVELTEKIHVDAYKAKGWTVVPYVAKTATKAASAKKEA